LVSWRLRYSLPFTEFIGGTATRFTPNPGGWFSHRHDEYGTGVEVYPACTELRPAGPEGASFAMTEPIRPGHFALRNRSQRSQSPKAGSATARRRRLPSDGSLDREYRMVELLTPAFATEFLMLTCRRGVHAA
jgi:hypothetical protein